MRIVYYTSGLTGVGRLIHGMAIGNALRRKNIRCDYTILHTSPMGHLADDFDHLWIPIEMPEDLSEKNFHKSVLYKTLSRLKPDILLVNHLWYMLYHFSQEMPCKKVYLSDQAYESHFKLSLPGGDIAFKNEQYDRVFSIEPFKTGVPMEKINPLILRNRDEILSRETAMKRLGLGGKRKAALYSFSASPEQYDRFLEKYSYLDDEYEVIRTSSYKNGIFPAVDYFNAFDLVICGGGYNQVWEAVYFKKKGIFEPLPMQFSDQSVRIKASKIFHFEENGADQLVDIIMNL